MKENAGKFDDNLVKRIRNESCMLAKDAGLLSNSKVNSGKVGGAKRVLSQELQDKIQQKWKRVVEPVTKCGTYPELRASWREG